MSRPKGTLDNTRIERMTVISDHVIEILKANNPSYGESWRKYEGFSAFFNLDRKWSRIEASAANCNYDIFEACEKFPNTVDGLLDLIGYALLILDNRVEVVDDKIVLKSSIERKEVHEDVHLQRDSEDRNGSLPSGV